MARRWPIVAAAVVVPVAWVAILAVLHLGDSTRSGNEPAEGVADDTRIGRFPRSQFYIERDRFLAATDPRTLPASDATWLRPDDEVFGVVVQGAARAYPVTMLSYHHVVNDRIHGIPIAVTY